MSITETGSGSSVKQQVKTLLQQRGLEELLDLCQRDRRFWSALRRCLYETDENLSWPAIETVAGLMKRWWQAGNQDKVREYVRILLWQLNDESGGIGWNAPQTIAEVVMAIPQLLDPYCSMMIARTIDEPALIKSGLWGIGRLGTRIREAVAFFQDKVLGVLDSDDPETLGLAAWAVGEVGFAPALPPLEKLSERTELVRLYVAGGFQEKPLGQWAKEAIDRIDK
ncbi:DVU0298 family protein [Chloroflexota bacterium]